MDAATIVSILLWVFIIVGGFWLGVKLNPLEKEELEKHGKASPIQRDEKRPGD